jgi:hypothetical protein
MSTDFNTDWAAMKADYAAQEAAQERAAYTAKMERDDRLDARRPTTDAWTLRIMREAKAVRDAAGEPIEELDSYLALCEAAVAEVGATVSRDDAPPAPRTGGGSGASNYGAANAPSEAQLRFIASLSRDLGRELETPRDKRHASLIIDRAKQAVDAARRSGATTPAVRTERPATERQVEFLAALLAERAHTLGELDPAGLSAARASELIDTLTRAPRAAVAPHGIREGRYAHQPADGSPAQFYRVGRTGRITVQAGPAEHPYRGKLNEALEAIKADPKAAAALYGQLIGSCGRCGLPLTDEDSRSRGLGPVCAGKSEW